MAARIRCETISLHLNGKYAAMIEDQGKQPILETNMQVTENEKLGVHEDMETVQDTSGPMTVEIDNSNQPHNVSEDVTLDCDPAKMENGKLEKDDGTNTNDKADGTEDKGPNDDSMAQLEEQTRQQELDRLLWLSLPENDQMAYYSDPDEASDCSDIDQPGPSEYSNRGQKLKAFGEMRWVHRGKLGSWTEARKEREWQEREERRVDAFQHASVDALLQAESMGPGGMGGIWRETVPVKRRGNSHGAMRKRTRTQAWKPHFEDDQYENDLNSDEHTSLRASTLALSLLVPVLSARGLLESKSLKQTFRNPHLTALNRTALNLIESEHVMSCALGRCFGVMERTFQADERYSDAFAPLTGSQETESAAQRKPLDPMDLTPPLGRIHDLFITKAGLTVPVASNPQDQQEPETVTISPEEQSDIVYTSLEYLNDLYADSREYMERLEEIRSMLAEVKRNRSFMWDIIRRWALKREQQDYQSSRQYHLSRAKRADEITSLEGGRDENGANDSNGTSPKAGEWSSTSRSRSKRRAGRT